MNNLISIEKIENGFLIYYISEDGVSKLSKKTVNGIVDFIEQYWGDKKIILEDIEEEKPRIIKCKNS